MLFKHKDYNIYIERHLGLFNECVNGVGNLGFGRVGRVIFIRIAANLKGCQQSTKGKRICDYLSIQIQIENEKRYKKVFRF